MHRVTICTQTNHTKKKVLLMKNMSYHELKTHGGNKFRIRVHGVFDNNGQSLSEDDFVYQRETVTRLFRGDGYVVLSTTGEFGSLQKESRPTEAPVNVLAINTYVPLESFQQIRVVARMRGVQRVVGMPDLHPGEGGPVGIACLSSQLHPELIGGDIGCGMGVWQLGIKHRMAPIDRWAQGLNLEGEYPGDTTPWIQTTHPRGLGTIGMGNHFAELQVVERVHDIDTFQKMELDAECLFLVVHSGSREYGKEVAHRFHGPTKPGDYINLHDQVVKWARVNRELIAHRFMTGIGCQTSHKILDIVHNNVVRHQVNDTKFWLHRKGAVPADKGPVIIPGSRGAMSYLVQPTADFQRLTTCLHSLAHGAGRRWNRQRMLNETIINHKIGNHVVCDNKDLLKEEAPEAYKDIEDVIADLVEHGLVTIIASLRPVLTYKQRGS